MTPKDTKSSDDTQAALPFGALPDSASSDSATGSKPKRAKKTASKKAASKKTSTKKAASKKAASSKSAVAAEGGDDAPKPRTRKPKVTEEDAVEGAADDAAPKRKAKKKVVRKSSRSAVAEAESNEPVVTSGEEAPVKRKRATRTKTEGSESSDSGEAVVTFAPRGGAERDASAADRDDAGSGRGESGSRGSRTGDSSSDFGADIGGNGAGGEDGSGEDGKGRKRKARRGRRRRRGGDADGEAPAGEASSSGGDEGAHMSQRDGSEGHGRQGDGGPPRDGSDEEGGSRRSRRRRRRRRRGGERDGEDGGGADANPSDKKGGHKSSQKGSQQGSQKGPKRDAHSGDGHRKGGKGSRGDRDGAEGGKGSQLASGMFILEKGQVSVLRLEKNQWMSSKEDIYVPKKLVQQFKLRDGMIVTGPTSKGYKHKVQLDGVQEIDDHPPQFWKNKPTFKNLTSIDPDFHYAVGDITDDVSMRVMDLIAPVGRGQRGLLVAPPRSGKTTLMRQFADGLEKGYPDVHLMVLLIDERPEEATEWTRSVTNGTVFVSTADESAKNHINLAELVWRRAMRLVEMGEDVVLLLDSITRLARAYNNQSGSGRTMSGGLDSGAMERPRKIFGSARNTVEAGSLTILGTTLVETGSRMDQMVFEEFKGTGNMELVLNRKLADRRIFPAIDLEKSGTRKEEKLVGMRRLKQIHTLRRVISRMHFAEAADLLITRLSDVEKTDEFLERFTVDPEA